MKRLSLIGLAATLTACGSVAPLRPPEGKPLPVKPFMAQVTPTAEDLLAKPPFAAPQRIDELVTKSMPRKADRFDLPPPDGGAAPLAGTDPAQPADATRVSDPR